MEYRHNAAAAAAFVGAAIAVVIAVNLVNPITSAITDVNATALGTGGTALLTLVGLVFVAVIVLYTLSILA